MRCEHTAPHRMLSRIPYSAFVFAVVQCSFLCCKRNACMATFILYILNGVWSGRRWFGWRWWWCGGGGGCDGGNNFNWPQTRQKWACSTPRPGDAPGPALTPVSRTTNLGHTLTVCECVFFNYQPYRIINIRSKKEKKNWSRKSHATYVTLINYLKM